MATYALPEIHYKFESANPTLNNGTSGSSKNIILASNLSVAATEGINGSGCLQIANGGSTASSDSCRTSGGGMTLPGSFTISMWAKASSFLANKTLLQLTHTSGIRILWAHSGTLYGYINESLIFAFGGPSAAFNGIYHHYVMIFNGTNFTPCMDGIVGGTAGGIPDMTNEVVSSITLGASSTFSHPHLNGSIDDFRYYPYAINSTQAVMLYKIGSNTSLSTLSTETVPNLINSGASVSQLISIGKTYNEIIAGGYTIPEIVASGVTIVQLVNGEVTFSQFTSAGYTVVQLIAGGITIVQLVNSGATFSQLLAGGATVSQLIAGGATVSQLIASGSTFNWLDLSAVSNVINKSYVNNLVDLSGDMIIRNNGALIVGGDASFNNITVAGSTKFANDTTLKSRLFVGSDINGNGNLSVGGDLSVNGQFSGNFANNLIPTSAIINYPSNGGSNVVITGNVRVAGDASFNGTTVDLSTNTILRVNGQITFNDGTIMSTYDDNILSGSFALGTTVFKDSTFAAVACTGVARATTKTTSSDYRIKTNVTELDESYTVDNLVPIQYDNMLSNIHEFGLIAHELQAVYPELVKGDKDGEEYQRVNYNGLIGVLVKEVQDLKRRKENLCKK